MLKRARKPERRAEIEAELVHPPLPPSVRYLWAVFRRLSDRRPSGFGISLIAWSEIDAFQRVTGFAMTPWEVEVIEMLDTIFVGQAS